MQTIGKIADQAEVSIDTVRFYERNGLLPDPQRTQTGYRLYPPDTIKRLQFIRRAKSLGFSLEEIKALLKLNDGGGQRTAVRRLAMQRYNEVQEKITALERIRTSLGHLIHECDGQGSLHGCPIISAMLEDAPERSRKTQGTKGASKR